MPFLDFAALRLFVIGATLGAVMSSADASDEPLHLLFWEQQDIRDGKNVRFEVHAAQPHIALLAEDPGRTSLWYSPAHVVRVEDGLRVYYRRIDRSLPERLDHNTFCVGILGKDGGFVCPDLGLLPNSWGGPTNVVLKGSPRKATWGGFNVFQMLGDFENGFQLLYWDQPEMGDAGGMIATSPDGIHWKKEETKRAVFTEHNDAYTLTVNHRNPGEYLLYQTKLIDWPDKPFLDNIGNKRRVISIRRSTNLHTWTPQDVILEPDAQDAPETEFYFMKVFWYVNRYVGIVMKYYGDPAQPGRHSALYRHEALFSRDGVQWTRPYRYTDFGVWSYADPFEYKGNLCLISGANEGRSMALYRLRKDGFASCGSDGEGSFWTQLFEMPEAGLYLNADCESGAISVEVLDENGQVVDGFGRDACRFAGNDSTALPLEWGERKAAELAGQRVHLRFALDNARVYSVTAKN